MNIIFATEKKVLNQVGMNLQMPTPMSVGGQDHLIYDQFRNHTIIIPL